MEPSSCVASLRVGLSSSALALLLTQSRSANKQEQSSTMSLSPRNTQAVHLASSLNNVGVAMLLRGEFRAAANVTKDAMTIVKLVLSAEGQEDPCNRNENEAYIRLFAQQRMQAAYSLLAQITSRPTRSAFLTNMGLLQLNQVESNDFDSIKQASMSSSLCFSAVTIREACTPVGYENISAIMIYNHGLACFLCTSFLEFEGSKVDLHNAAEKSLFIAYTTFSRTLVNPQSSKLEMEAALYSMLSLSLVTQVLKARNDNAKAHETEQAYQHILQALKEEHPVVFMSKEMVCSIVAPAA